MVKYGEYLNEPGGFNRNPENNSEKRDEGEDKPYLDVWNVNPTYKDVDRSETIRKSGSIVLIAFLFFASLSYTTYNFVLASVITLTVVLSFVVIFHKEFYSLRHWFDFKSFNPFQDLIFWQPEFLQSEFLQPDAKSSLFFTNYRDLTTTGVKIFQITVIPENVHANLSMVLRGLDNTKVPYSYQVVHKPLQIGSSNANDQNSTYETAIYFSTFYKIKGRITKSKVEDLVKNLQYQFISLKSAFASNFHHFRIVTLSNKELIDAYRSSALKQSVAIEPNSKKNTSQTIKPSPLRLWTRGIYMVTLVVLLDLVLLPFGLPMILRITISSAILFALLAIWWSELMFQTSKKALFDSKEINIVDPFSEIKFFKIRKSPESIYYQIEGKLVGGIKMINLKFAYPPAYCSPSKFYEALINGKMPHTTTAELHPLSFSQFDDEAFKFLKQEVKNQMLATIDNEIKAKRWLANRAGIWTAMVTYSTSTVINAPTINYEVLDKIERALAYQQITLRTSFEENFRNFEFEQLRKNQLESGFVFEVLKNKFIRRNGSHLNYVAFQGVTLERVTQLSDLFKKGVETRLAAEFNTPLQLINHVTVGNTINTEFLENEVPAGFLFSQLKNLFITNGTNASRELLSQKIVIELVKAGYPSVVFDFTGNWSKLLRMFQGTIYESQFVYHKLGKTFVINPLRSGILYDTDNPRYLDFMFDAYAMCFKKDERTIDTFKNTILRNPDIDVSTLVLDLTTQRDWEKSSVTETLLTFFKEFTPQESSFIQRQQPQTQDTAQAHEFIVDDKTVIIDLSELADYDKQCFFALVVVSKFIHYLRSGKTFVPKFVVMPHVDIAFDGFFLEKNMQYGKLDKFFEPLREKAFGTIYSASQIRYLHPNTFNYFDNIVTFRTTDKRDVAVLNGLMNLENLHGVGYYSNRRNEGYQVRYIGAMKQDEAVVKREDIYQLFPIKLDFKDILETQALSWDEIVSYMENLGYDLEKTVTKIMKRAQTTLFESDFAGYSDLIEGVIKFLNNLQTVDKVGNMYKKKVKEELQKVLHSYILRVTNDKKREKEIIDEVFTILVQQQYLVETHPKRASGSESMQTSFAVGNHYQKALKDFYESRESTEVTYEPIEIESESESEGPKAQRGLNPAKLRSALTEHFAPVLYYEFFTIHKNINQKRFEKALKTAKTLLKKYLHSAYKSYYSVNYAITRSDIDNFIALIAKLEGFPFDQSDLTEYLAFFDGISIDDGELEKKSTMAFEAYATIFDKFKGFVEGEIGGI